MFTEVRSVSMSHAFVRNRWGSQKDNLNRGVGLKEMVQLWFRVAWQDRERPMDCPIPLGRSGQEACSSLPYQKNICLGWWSFVIRRIWRVPAFQPSKKVELVGPISQISVIFCVS